MLHIMELHVQIQHVYSVPKDHVILKKFAFTLTIFYWYNGPQITFAMHRFGFVVSYRSNVVGDRRSSNIQNDAFDSFLLDEFSSYNSK